MLQSQSSSIPPHNAKRVKPDQQAHARKHHHEYDLPERQAAGLCQLPVPHVGKVGQIIPQAIHHLRCPRFCGGLSGGVDLRLCSDRLGHVLPPVIAATTAAALWALAAAIARSRETPETIRLGLDAE